MNPNSSGSRRQRAKQTVSKEKVSRGPYGDKLHKSKSKSNLRLVFQNINGFGTDDDTRKDKMIQELINKYKIDAFALSEVNTNWKIVKKKHSLSHLATEWFENSQVNGP